ncbi:hypothetical protein RUND412_003976 [Rhizina undulata]
MTVARKLLVCSIGNPAPYIGTRHSAGHTVIELVRQTLQYSPFSIERTYGGLVSFGIYDQQYTLFQSPSLMNVSGKPVKNAWRAFLQDLHVEERDRALLVVLHDELDKALGQVKVKKTGSPSGHNGLKSCIEYLQTKDFYRLGVGIGRPDSKESREISNYVLGKMTSFEKRMLEASLPKVLEALKGISKTP